MATNRNHTVDILRGCAIFFVVFGHVTHNVELRTYIWGFHIPIFFFLSGLLFKKEKFLCFRNFLASRFKSLLVPYAIFYLLTYIYWLLVERHVRGADISPISQLFGLVYGTYDMRFMMFNGALGFIPCLFSMEISFWLLAKSKRKGCILFFSLISYVTGLYMSTVAGWLPWGICAALIGMVFYSLGFLNKGLLVYYRSSTRSRLSNFVLFLCLLGGQILLLPWTGADLAMLKVGNVWLYIPIALLGISAYWCFSIVLAKNLVLEFLGRNSLVIFAFQEPVYRIIIFVSAKVLSVDVEQIRCNIVLCLLIAIISIAVIMPLIYGWNRYGKKQIAVCAKYVINRKKELIGNGNI